MLHVDDLSDPSIIAHELDYLRQYLSEKYRQIDEQLLDEAIEAALMRHCIHPERFDSAYGVSVHFYLALWSRSYLDKRLRKEKWHREHEKASGVSEKNFEKIVSGVRVKRGIYLGRDGSEQEVEEREEKEEKWREALAEIVAHLNPSDRVGVQLLRAGASREEWVCQLGIASLPRNKQQRKIDAEKDRIRKKLKRWAQKMQGGGVAFGSEREFGQPVLTRVESANHG